MLPPSSANQKLLFYTDSTYFSGAEKSLAVLAETARKHGHTVTLMCTPQVQERFADFLPAAQIIGTVTRSKLSFSWFRAVKRQLQETQPDHFVVNMWSPYANTLALLAARRTGRPVISIYHYYQRRSQVTGPLAPVKRWAYRWAERLAAQVLTVSEAHRQVLIDEFGFPATKVAVLHNGINGPQEQPTFTDHSPRRLLAVGSLEESKGYDFLLKTLAKVTTPFTLTIMGDGPERPKLEALAKTITQPVVFGGLQKQLDTVYPEFDVLVHPSLFENLSMAILEGMAHGLAVIANDVGGNNELVSDQHEGWLLPLNDESAWVAALTAACSAPLTAFRHASYARWESQFTAEHQYEQFMRYLHEK